MFTFDFGSMVVVGCSASLGKNRICHAGVRERDDGGNSDVDWVQRLQPGQGHRLQHEIC